MTGMNMGMMGMGMMIPLILIGIALFFAVAALFNTTTLKNVETFR